MLPPVTYPPALDKRGPPPISLSTAPSGTGPGRAVSIPIGPPVIKKKESLILAAASKDPPQEDSEEADTALQRTVNPKLEHPLSQDSEPEDRSECSTQIG